MAPASLQELAAPLALLEDPAMAALQEPPWLLRLKRQQALQVLLPLAAELLLAASLRRRRLVPQQAAALPLGQARQRRRRRLRLRRLRRRLHRQRRLAALPMGQASELLLVLCEELWVSVPLRLLAQRQRPPLLSELQEAAPVPSSLSAPSADAQQLERLQQELAEGQPRRQLSLERLQALLWLERRLHQLP